MTWMDSKDTKGRKSLKWIPSHWETFSYFPKKENPSTAATPAASPCTHIQQGIECTEMHYSALLEHDTAKSDHLHLQK